MQIYILDSYLDIIGVIDCYTSLIWTTKKGEIGDFELVVPALVEHSKLLKLGNFVGNSDDPGTLMLITSVSDKSNSDEFSITATGATADTLLERRLYPYWAYPLPKDLDETVRVIQPFYFNIVNGSTGYFGPFAWDNLPDDASKSNLYDLIQYEISAQIAINENIDEHETTADKSMWFQFVFGYNLFGESQHNIKGFVATVNAVAKDAVPVAMFSEDLENLSSVEYSESDDGIYTSIFAEVNTGWSGDVKQTNTEGVVKDVNISYDELYNRFTNTMLAYATVATNTVECVEKVITVDPVVVQYSGAIIERVKVPVFVGEWTGPEEKDKYCVAMDKNPEGGEPRWIYQTNVVASEKYQVDQNATLENAKSAIEKEIQNSIINIQGEVDAARAQKRPNLGDVVVFRDDKVLREVVKPVTEIQRSYDSSGERLNLTFGDPLKTIFDIWK